MQVVGQREIFAIAENKEATLDLFDALQRDTMAGLERETKNLVAGLSRVDDDLPRLEPKRQQLSSVINEIARLESELRRHEASRAPLARVNLLKREQVAVQMIDSTLAQIADTVDAFADELVLGVGTSGFRSPDTENAREVGRLLDRAQYYVSELVIEVKAAAERLREKLFAEERNPERATWGAALSNASAVYMAMTADTDDSIVSEDGGGPIEQLERLRIELIQLEKEIAALEKRATERPGLLNNLRNAWQRQIDARKGLAGRLIDLVPRTDRGDPFIEVLIQPYADEVAVATVLERVASDHRSISRDELEDLAKALVSVAKDANPLEVFVESLDASESDADPGVLSVLRPGARRYLETKFGSSERRRLQLTRIPDRATLTLRRMDGELAGTLEDGLSVGQRCTAILALILSAHQNHPVVIDQPEDEIDNEYIYRELVPQLRQAKDTRQIILSTHNPNLPVNGDAEFIYPLEAVRSGGRVVGRPKRRRIDGKLAVGSLDNKDVKEAVEEITEGSEEAFRRRLARYGF
ncbi:MAG: hypothetical protein ACYDHP_03245 [Ferrimicrobium sp.]